MRKVFFFVALIFTFFVVYNIDFIQHRRSHQRVYRVPRENHTGWGKTIKKSAHSDFDTIFKYAQYTARVDIDGEL